MEINEYSQIIVAKIPVGKGEGKIGYNERMSLMGGMPGPISFAINTKNEVFVCDLLNKRVNIYDLNFSYIKTINNSILSSCEKLKFNKNGELIGYNIGGGFISSNRNGDNIYLIDSNDIPLKVRSHQDFFVFDNYLLYYDNELTDNIVLIDGFGKKAGYEQKKDVLNNLAGGIEQEILAINKAIDGSDAVDRTKQFINERKIVKYKQKLMTSNFAIHREYFTLLKNSKYGTQFIDSVEFDNTAFNSMKIIGFDERGNSYWKCRLKKDNNDIVILVCSSFGEVLDIFDDKYEFPCTAIAPNGDVYFMPHTPFKGDLDYIRFYKVECRW